jgi:hypothetical protein
MNLEFMNMDSINESRAKVRGKILLYTTPDRDALPAMVMNQDVTNHLPTILEKLSSRYSPIRSKINFFA